MRVLYSFPHGLGRSGIGTTAYHQVQESARRGLEVLVCCTSLERELDPGIEVVETMVVAGRRVPHRAIGVQRAYEFHDRRAARLLRRRAHDVDVVHVWPAGCLQTIAAANQLGLPTVREVPNTHTAHAFDVAAAVYQELGLRPPSDHSHTPDGPALRRELTEYDAVDMLLVPSLYSLETFRRAGVPESRLALHQYGFDPASFHPQHPPAHPDHGGIRAVFIGSCEPRKGLHLALRAWMDSGAAERGRFVICGDFVPGYREALEPWLAHPSVVVRGFTDEPARLLAESDVLVLPSLEEGSALVTYEAQASGCALVVSDATGAMAEHGVEALIHRAGDLDVLTEHIARLDREPELVKLLRRNAVANSARLTWADAAADLETTYTAVASGAPRPAVADTIAAVERLRPEFEAVDIRRLDADLDYFLEVVRSGPSVIRPHVVSLASADGLPLLAVARLEHLSLPIRLGYWVAAKPTVRALVVSLGGLAGAGTEEDLNRLTAGLTASLATGEADLLLFPKVELSSPEYAAMSRAGTRLTRSQASQPTTRWTADIPDSVETFLSARSARSRRKLRNHDRQVERKFADSLRLVEYTEPEEFDRIASDLARVAERTYQHGLGQAFNDSALGLPLMALALRHGWYRCWVLFVSERPVAFWHGYLYKGVFSTLTPGYDPDFAEEGFGSYVMMRMFEALCADPKVRRLDFGSGAAYYKAAFGTSSTSEVDVTITAARIKPIAMVRLARWNSALQVAMDSLATRTSAGRHLKRGWRRRIAGTVASSDDRRVNGQGSE